MSDGILVLHPLESKNSQKPKSFGSLAASPPKKQTNWAPDVFISPSFERFPLLLLFLGGGVIRHGVFLSRGYLFGVGLNERKAALFCVGRDGPIPKKRQAHPPTKNTEVEGSFGILEDWGIGQVVDFRANGLAKGPSLCSYLPRWSDTQNFK